MYSIRNAISHHENISTALANTLFDKQISPILLYGSALWILPEVNRYAKINITNTMNWFAYKQVEKLFQEIMGREIPFEKTPIQINREDKYLYIKFVHWKDKEDLIRITNASANLGLRVSDHNVPMHDFSTIDKVQGKFLKFSLGLSKFASTSAVLRELGQYPVTLKGIRLALMYYYRLRIEVSPETHPILSAALSCMQESNNPWLENVEFCFAKFGLSNIFMNITTLHKSYVNSKISQRLHDTHAQENISYLEKSDHLQTFYSCVSDSMYTRSKYLTLIDTPSIRSTYARLRLNCSKLSPNPYSKISKQCETCGCTLELIHCLLLCPRNKPERDRFLQAISGLCPGFESRSSSEQFRSIMNLHFNLKSNEIREKMISITISFVMKTYKVFLSGLWNS